MPTDRDNIVANFAQNAFQAHCGPLRRYLAKRLGSSKDVDDLAQEVFARLLRVNDVELVRNPIAYVLGIATHVVREFKQRAHTECVIFDSDVFENAGGRLEDNQSNTVLLQHELRQIIERALQELPATHRLVFLLVKREGLSYSEAAGKTGLSPHTIQKYLVEARAQLRMAVLNSERQK